MRGKLPRGYVWRYGMARREDRMGRAKEGMGIRKKLIEKGTRIETQEEGIIVGRLRQGKEVWRIIGAYVNGDIEEKLRKIERWRTEREG